MQTIDNTSPTVGTVPSRLSTPRAAAVATPCTCRPSLRAATPVGS